MVATFGGKNVFGIAQKVQGPFLAIATQSSTLPGVDGERLYSLGKRNQTWTVRGRLVSVSLNELDKAIRLGQSLMDGAVHNFGDGRRGTQIKNCQMVDYRPVGAVEPVLYGGAYQYTTEVVATVKCLAPT